jgi:transcription antitermination factor NusG
MAMRWYSVSVLSNFEKKVAEAIKEAARQQHLEIAEVMVPTEDVIEIRRGKKVQTEKRFMPGYVLVKMEMSDRTYHAITSLNREKGRGMQVFEFESTMPSDNQNVNTNARLHPTTCQLTNSFVAN